jgi:hypothetical protein
MGIQVSEGAADASTYACMHASTRQCQAISKLKYAFEAIRLCCCPKAIPSDQVCQYSSNCASHPPALPCSSVSLQVGLPVHPLPPGEGGQLDQRAVRVHGPRQHHAGPQGVCGDKSWKALQPLHTCSQLNIMRQSLLAVSNSSQGGTHVCTPPPPPPPPQQRLFAGGCAISLSKPAQH